MSAISLGSTTPFDATPDGIGSGPLWLRSVYKRHFTIRPTTSSVWLALLGNSGRRGQALEAVRSAGGCVYLTLSLSIPKLIQGLLSKLPDE